MPRNKIDAILFAVLIFACLSACALFLLLPLKAFDTGLVYQGF
jgi:hypothetical protein